MSTAQDIWNAYKDLLKRSYIERSFDVWSDLWAENGRLVVKLGSQGPDGYSEDHYVGREKVVDLFSSSSGRIEIELEDEGPVYEAKNAPGSFMVMSEFIATILASDKRYPNHIVCRISYDPEGRITEFVEYADPIRRGNFLQALSATGS